MKRCFREELINVGGARGEMGTGSSISHALHKREWTASRSTVSERGMTTTK